MTPSSDSSPVLHTSHPEFRTTLRGIPDVIAFFVAIPAGVALAIWAEGALAAFSAIVFSVTLALMLGTSSIYHTILWPPKQSELWSRLDYAGIYLLIGGTYTPFCLLSDMPHGPYLLGFVWACALFGAGNCVLRPNGSRLLRTVLYVLLGVAMVPYTPSLYEAIPGRAFVLSFCGGASYITGAVIYAVAWPNPIPKHYGHHEVFHLFVFGGAACHYFAILQIVTFG